VEDGKRLVRMFVDELWNERRLELASTIFDENSHTHQLQSGLPIVAIPRGPAAIKAHISDWVSAFPDLRFNIEQMISEGDRVFSQLTIEGTQTGQWLGIPPTGIRVNIRMTTIHRIQSGKIIEDWVLVDSLGLFQQLGALPPTKDFLAKSVRRDLV
jgi:predicted ester cyclase